MNNQKGNTIIEQMLNILNYYQENVGEFRINDGYLVKNAKNKATLTLDYAGKLISAKFIYTPNNSWVLAEAPTDWSIIKDLTLLP